eukprot:Skav221509  [mRNA]  locus=scaffold5053:19065:19865:+ [translate_table: standard]
MGGRAQEGRSKEIESSQVGTSSHSSRSSSSGLRAPAPRGRPHLEADHPSPSGATWAASPPKTLNQRKETRGPSHRQSEGSPSAGRNGKRPRSECDRKTRPLGPPQQRVAQYGFDLTRFHNKTDALNGFVMRLVGPVPGQPSSWKLKAPKVEGGNEGGNEGGLKFQSTLTLDSHVCAKIWPKEGPTKCFVGEICEDRKDAKESAVNKFWEDPDVKKIASTLPPSRQQEYRTALRNERMARQIASNEAKRGNRLAEAQQARSQARCQR